MNIEIKVIKLGKLFLAVTTLGGITIRGRSASEIGDAVRNLLWKLAGQDDDARVALELTVHNTDLDAATNVEALGDGSDR